jgi:hypothetical protein
MSQDPVAPSMTPTPWLEMARGLGGHGGPGWDLGECIWSPSDVQWGGYRVLTKPVVGSLVIHCYQGQICGWSRVARPCRLVYGSGTSRGASAVPAQQSGSAAPPIRSAILK